MQGCTKIQEDQVLDVEACRGRYVRGLTFIATRVHDSTHSDVVARPQHVAMVAVDSRKLKSRYSFVRSSSSATAPPSLSATSCEADLTP